MSRTRCTAGRIHQLTGLLIISLLLPLVSACTSTAPAGSASSGIPQSSPADDRSYRYLTLDNGLRALVISDPQADKAAAALVVTAGSYDEPPERLGLAHFLEHMLFLGTEKYPDPDAYKNFLATHGGSSNAYTSTDHTNYFFDVAPEQFDGALDRFAQFFVAPLFTAAYVDREKNAVDSEYQMQSRDDGWRGFVVGKNALNPEHPASHFNIGTLDTLADRDGSSIRDELLNFHQQHYSADAMTLVVLARASTDKLATMVAAKFNAVPRFATTNQTTPALYRAEDLPALLQYRPVKNQRVLEFAFAIPATAPQWQSKPDNYLASLIGHEGEGSLHAELTRRGWIESLSAGGGRLSDTDSVFEVQIALTESGLDHVEDIGHLLFAYFDLLRSRGVQKWLYREQADLAALGFRFQEHGSPMQTVNSLAAASLTYPLQDILRGPYAMDRYDPAGIRALLDALRPEKAQVNLSWPEAPATGTEPWFGVEYSLSRLPEAWLQHWQQAAASSETALALPAANPFIPANLDLISEGNPASKPEDLGSVGGVHLWYSPDTTFAVPRANVWLKLASPAAAEADAGQAALTILLTRMVEDAMNATLYPARLAGLGYNLQPHNQGLLLSIGGYNDKQAVLLTDLLRALETTEFSDDRFQTLRAELVRTWRNARENRPYQRTLASLGQDVQTRSFHPDDLADALAAASLQDLNNWRRSLLGQLHLDTLVQGNHNRSAAKNLASVASRQLLSGAQVVPSVPPRDVLWLPPQRTVLALVPTHPDAAMTLYVQGRDTSWSSRAAMGLLGDMLSTPYFNSLRTEQQLGYVVSAGNRTYRSTPGLIFLIQSPVAGADALYQRTVDFLDSYSSTLGAMPATEFDAAREGFLTKLLERPRNLAEQGQRYWDDLDKGNSNFDTREAIAEATRNLDLAAIQALLAQVRDDVDQRALVVVTAGRFNSLPEGELRQERSVSGAGRPAPALQVDVQLGMQLGMQMEQAPAQPEPQP